jgi:hypothetical protein
MSIASINTATSPALGPAEASKTRAAEKARSGSAHKHAPTPAKKASSSNDAGIIRQLVAQHVSFAAIAQRLGKPVSTILKEAAAAGINLNAGSVANTAIALATEEHAGTESIGNNLDLKA